MKIIGVCFWVTTKCNLKCNICYAYLNSVKNNSTDGYLKIINKLQQLEIKKIAFTGGDPLLVKDLDIILANAKSKGFKVALTTNALLVNEEKLSILENIIHELSIPMDGFSAEVSQIHRTKKYNLENIKHLIRKSEKYNIRIDVSTVITRINQHEILRILDFLEENKIYKWKCFQYSQLDKPKGMKIDFNISTQEFTTVRNEITKTIRYNKYNIQVDFRGNDPSAINSYVNVLPNGKLILSKKNKYVFIGNILDYSSSNELSYLLVENGFSFFKHHERHFRDAQT